MLSIHVNSTPGAFGTETFYRGTGNRAKATTINQTVCGLMKTRNRGAKTERQSQHSSLAVMAFQPCFLLELGFIENDSDRAKMLNPELRLQVCQALAEILKN